MKQIKLIFFIYFFATTLFGQKSEIENLMNQASKEVVPQDFKFYNLVDSSFTTKFDKHSLRISEIKTLQQKFPDFPIDAFIEKATNDTTIFNWKDFDLNKAKVFSYTEIPKFDTRIQFVVLVPWRASQKLIDSLKTEKKHPRVVVPIKKHWSKKRIDKEVHKSWKNYASSTKPENITFFRFSTPLMIGHYALVTLNQTGRGATYIFKKTDHVWKQIFVFKRWVN